MIIHKPRHVLVAAAHHSVLMCSTDGGLLRPIHVECDFHWGHG